MGSISAILAATEAEVSKVPFYVAGGLLAAWAVIVAVVGIVRDGFPSTRGTTAAVMVVTGLLVAVTMFTSISTS